MSAEPREQSLRVLIANEKQERLGTLTDVLTSLGHVVVAAGVEVTEIGGTTRQEHPDVALVALGESSDHALDLISQIVHEAACPVIALLHTSEPEFVNEAAKRGIFAYITDDDPVELQSALDIVLRRFAEYHNLEGAFARRGDDRTSQRHPYGHPRDRRPGSLRDAAQAVPAERPQNP